MKNKKTLLLIFATIATLILAVIAVITSMKLKQLATVPVTPNAPVSQPKAVELPIAQVDLAPVCQLTFTVSSITCNGTCANDADCDSGLACSAGKCRNPSCVSETDCDCPEPTPTPTPSPTPTPTPSPTPTPTPTPTPSPTPKLAMCNIGCNPNETNTGCTDGLMCEPNSRKCRKPACPSEEDCECPTASPTPTPKPSTTPQPTVVAAVDEEIIKAGNATPGLLFLMTGGLLVILGVLAVSL